MTVEIKVPTLPESVSDAVVAKWYKSVGDFIERDENLVDLETDKVMLEVPAPESGVIDQLMVNVGDTVGQAALLAVIKPGAAPAKTQQTADPVPSTAASALDVSPAVRRLAAEQGIDLNQVAGTGKSGRITKQDVQQHMAAAPTVPAPAVLAADAGLPPMGARTQERVPMSRLRARIAERLVQVQHEAALLTTFNEVDMQPVMDLRKRYKDIFEKTHQARLGFMSFFTKAVVEALKRFPAVNASIDGSDLIYHHYYDIGIAIGSDRGLVVPILRNAELLSLAEIEQQIRSFAAQAQSGKLAIEQMTGGTFTITNGGTYGSMLSTPIINPPQTAILGMHNIVERAVVIDGQIVARPMMYLALSYDHRVIDGREAVLFLRSIKDALEDPARMLLNV